MIDFGVLTAIRDLLTMHNTVSNEAGTDNIYISYPAKSAIKPMVVLELEEVWTSLALGQNSPCAKLKLKAQTLSDKMTSKESLTISEKVRALIDGKTINLENGKSVTLKLANSIIDIPTDINKTRNVKQFFEAIVRE
jgi:hypothetical protein